MILVESGKWWKIYSAFYSKFDPGELCVSHLKFGLQSLDQSAVSSTECIDSGDFLLTASKLSQSIRKY